MAAKQQGKKKAGVPKRKNIYKKHQQARWNQKKFQVRKPKKQQPCLKRQAKRTSATKSRSSGQPQKICSSKLFASKILRLMPKVRMAAKTRNLMKTLLADFYNYVVIRVDVLSKIEEEVPISGDNVQAALKEATKHSVEQPIISATECT